MQIVQPRHDHLSFDVYHFRFPTPVRRGVFIRADIQNPAVFDRDSLGPGLLRIDRVNPAVNQQHVRSRRSLARFGRALSLSRRTGIPRSPDTAAAQEQGQHRHTKFIHLRLRIQRKALPAPYRRF